MIVVKIQAGLGNQMFQYALGRALSLKNGDVLKLDISNFEHRSSKPLSVREYSLDHFNIAADIASSDEIDCLKYPHGRLSRCLYSIRAKFTDMDHIEFKPYFLSIKKDVYLEGYWQSYKYFSTIRQTLLDDFTPRSPLSQTTKTLLTEIENDRQSIALHVRRGDNVHYATSVATFGTPPTEYYLQAPDRVLKESGLPSGKLYIFSDDIEWAKHNLSYDLPVIYVSQEGIADWEEIILMAACRHNIIANSTFSWWGAWLNQNPEKIVIAPTRWANKHPEKYDSLIPDNWIRM